jgi:MFS family permease
VRILDVRVVSLIGGAHFVSHFFQLALPPLFPFLRDAFGVSYVGLGLLMSVFYAASGTGQTLAGFVVDRLGAPRILLAGMLLVSGAVALAGLSPTYALLIPLIFLAGLGNSVFHPADYAIFNASIDRRWLGRAYSVHTIGGTLGYASAPVTVAALASLAGWRAALVTVGAFGVAAALVLASQRHALSDHRQADRARPAVAPAPGGDARLLLAAPILAAFAYFALLATAQIGVQTFSVTALVTMYDAPLTRATGALTAFLLGSAAGTLAGGILADRTGRHDVVAAAGMLGAALLTAAVGSTVFPLPAVPVLMALVGFAFGATSPSRDTLIRAVTPVSASGKVYGFVYSGLDLGSSVTPLIFGWLLDHGAPRGVFFAAALLWFLTIAPVVQVGRGRPAAARL